MAWDSITTTNKKLDGSTASSEAKIENDEMTFEETSVPAEGPEGSSIKSTGETAGKVLTSDGEDGAEWTSLNLSDYATVDQAFNVINTSDIINDTLTDAQIAIMTNGKPTIIKGTVVGFNDCVFIKPTSYADNYTGVVIGVYNGWYGVHTYKIVGSTKKIQKQAQYICGAGFSGEGTTCYIDKVVSFNGKTIPSYPSSTGTFVLKCVDGTLTWVQE